MNKEELENKLRGFEEACYSEGYIYDVLSFDEAYLGVKPTSFIVNVVMKKSWVCSSTFSKALDKLIEILWKTTEAKTRENIFTLSLYTIDEMVNSERMRDREQIATNPDLTSKQINQLYEDKKQSIGIKIINNIKEGELTKQQIINYINTNNDSIIKLLTNRYSNDANFQEQIFKDPELKFEFLELAI